MRDGPDSCSKFVIRSNSNTVTFIYKTFIPVNRIDKSMWIISAGLLVIKDSYQLGCHACGYYDCFDISRALFSVALYAHSDQSAVLIIM